MKKNNKGFTLAELLIVVAVIAVLVAVAIPTFANQLEKSRQAVDISNLREAFAAARLAEMNQQIGEVKFTDVKGGNGTDKLDPPAGAPFKRAADKRTGAGGNNGMGAAVSATSTLVIRTYYNAKTGEFVYDATATNLPGKGATTMKAQSTKVVADKSKLNKNVITYGDTVSGVADTLTPSTATTPQYLVAYFVPSDEAATVTDPAGLTWKLVSIRFETAAGVEKVA